MADVDGAVVGFYAINAHTVSYGELPARYARTRPSHGNIPAAYLSMIGRDQRYRGRGYGNALLFDALKRVAGAAEHLGIAVVVLDVLDCGDPSRVDRRKALYESYGFVSMTSQPMRMFLPLSTVLAILHDAPPS